MRRSVILAVLLLALAALPALAEGMVYGGTDLWITPADGSTFSDFASNPIPSGFFCSGSSAFTGKIGFQGAPLASDSPGTLMNSDTVVQRLDDAAFDAAGKASTRLQVKALNLVSLAPVKTECGSFNVRATLAGDQPVTRMHIFRENDEGGRFLAPLALNVKLTFAPVGRSGRALELVQQVRFPANPHATWVADNNKSAGRYVRIDTDGDGRPDTLVPGPSNFRAGALPGKVAINPAIPVDTPGYTTAHTSATHTHTTTPPPPCGTVTNPLASSVKTAAPVQCPA